MTNMASPQWEQEMGQASVRSVVARGAVVGAEAVVLRDAPPSAVVFGPPVRPIGARATNVAPYPLDSPFRLFE